MEIDRNLVLDEETAMRLQAACTMFHDEGKEVSAQVIVRNTIAHFHNSLLQTRPAYATYLQKIHEEAQNDADAEGGSAQLLSEYPTEFQDLETGIDSIFLKRKFRCPMCGTAFTAPMLKTGSLIAKFDNRTQLDVYTGVRQDSDKEFIDYSLFLVMVCPGCLFAAQEREFDIWDASGREPTWKKRQKNKLPKKIIDLFLNNISRRHEIARKAARDGKNLFSTQRTENDAAVAIDIATDTLSFMIGKVSPARKPELIYQSGVMSLMKSLQFEKQLEDPDNQGIINDIRKKRLLAIRDALGSFNQVPDQSVENFEIRESIRFHARRFWAAHEMRDSAAFAASGAALQRINNQFVNMTKKLERDIATEEGKIKKLNEEIRKAGNMQKKEAFTHQAKEVENNMQLLRTGLENARGVLRVITPIYDAASVPYDKFKEIQRQRKAAQQQGA